MAATKTRRAAGGSKRAKSKGKSARAIPMAVRQSRVSRWGNSLGLRIPQDAADQLKLKAGEEVTVEVAEGTITIRRARRKWTEAELLQGVTPEMVGGEVDWGGPVGKEVW